MIVQNEELHKTYDHFFVSGNSLQHHVVKKNSLVFDTPIGIVRHLVEKVARRAPEEGKPPVNVEKEIRAATAMLGYEAWQTRAMNMEIEDQVQWVLDQKVDNEIRAILSAVGGVPEGPFNFVIMRDAEKNNKCKFYKLIKKHLAELKDDGTLNPEYNDPEIVRILSINYDDAKF